MHQSEPNDSKSFVAMLTEHQTLAGKSDDQMAAETGLANSKIYKLIRQGTIALPIHHVAPLAVALNIDASALLRDYMSAYVPDLLNVVDEVFQPLQLTSTEKRLIEHCRRLGKGRTTAPIVFEGKTVIALVAT